MGTFAPDESRTGHVQREVKGKPYNHYKKKKKKKKKVATTFRAGPRSSRAHTSRPEKEDTIKAVRIKDKIGTLQEAELVDLKSVTELNREGREEQAEERNFSDEKCRT